jgi:hypothetical protein
LYRKPTKEVPPLLGATAISVRCVVLILPLGLTQLNLAASFALVTLHQEDGETEAPRMGSGSSFNALCNHAQCISSGVTEGREELLNARRLVVWVHPAAYLSWDGVWERARREQN